MLHTVYLWISQSNFLPSILFNSLALPLCCPSFLLSIYGSHLSALTLFLHRQSISHSCSQKYSLALSVFQFRSQTPTLSLSISVTLLFYQFSSVFFYSSVRISVVLSICLFVCLFICLSVCLSLSVSLSVFLTSNLSCPYHLSVLSHLVFCTQPLTLWSVFRSACQILSHFFLFNSLIFSPCLSFSLSMNLSNSHRSSLTQSLFLAIIHISPTSPFSLYRS